MRILVAEDDAPLAEFLRQRLEQEQFSVKMVSNGAEAEQLASGQPQYRSQPEGVRPAGMPDAQRRAARLPRRHRRTGLETRSRHDDQRSGRVHQLPTAQSGCRLRPYADSNDPWRWLSDRRKRPARLVSNKTNFGAHMFTTRTKKELK